MLSADSSGLAILTAPSGDASCDSPGGNHSATLPGSEMPAAYQAGSRWSDTSAGGSGTAWGDATKISWSIAPDGTWIPGSTGESSSSSDFISFMNGEYGSAPGQVQQQPWFSLVESVFDRWSDVSGLEFVYEPQDDGAAFSNVSSHAPGIAGIRGDIRIGGHAIDGDSGTLAYNFFPDNGEMVLDTSDSFFQDTSAKSLRLRNVMSHELGHGIGLSHVDPVDQTKLMEPIASSVFDGPQLDDILAVHRLYGDPMESGQGNDSLTTAVNLGSLGAGPLRVGDQSIGQFASIDGVMDEDYFRFTAEMDSQLQVQLLPLGDRYQQGPVGSGATPFDSSSQNDLGFEIYNTQGQSIAYVDKQGPGAVENAPQIQLVAGRAYAIRVFGDRDAAQLYQLDLRSEALPALPNDVLNFSSQELRSYGGAQDHAGSVVVEQDGAALRLAGNRWKMVDLPYTITPQTMLEFDFSSTAQGDIHGIGFDSNSEISSDLTFRLYGDQNWGLDDFAQYESPGSTQHFTIPVGQYYSGVVSYLFFVNDHDVAAPRAESLFSNLRIYEGTPSELASSPPRARSDSFALDEDSPTVAVDVLANDLAGQSSVSVKSVSPGSAGGYVNLAADGRIHYRPAADFHGEETFSYTISNDFGDSTATVTATIRSVNDAPIVHDNQFTVQMNGAYRMDVLQNDSTGPDMDETLTMVDTSDGSAGGDVRMDGRTVIYTPNHGFVGTETFTYTVSDGSPGGIAKATVTVRVLPRTDGVVDFSDYRIDAYGGRQDRVGAALAEEGGTAIRMLGNTWKKIDFPYVITADTILEFDFASSSQGEIHGIGLDDNASITSSRTFRVAGSQDWGVDDFATYLGQGEFVHYVIPVGQYYTGAAAHLFLVNDQDVTSPDATSVFRNVRVYEAGRLASLQTDRVGERLSEESHRSAGGGATEQAAASHPEDPRMLRSFQSVRERYRLQRRPAGALGAASRLRISLGDLRHVFFVIHDGQNRVEIKSLQDGSHMRLQLAKK